MMNFGINNYKDLIEFISYIITSFSLIGIWITYAWSKKQIHFSTMSKCINDFREFLKCYGEADETLAFEYIDLVNEELFYLEKNYLPVDVAIEWIDGMIDWLPFYNANGDFIQSQNLSFLKNEQYVTIVLNGYPRILKVIQLNKTIDFEKVRLASLTLENRKLQFEERNKLIFEIISNLKLSFWRKRFITRKIASR
ncbi:hypothetical protein [Flavobacterium sp.]|uniref:hypothetical protein n=1 Tax=Flavobacterium sp. TaxID=239 RepID=UPI0039E444D2